MIGLFRKALARDRRPRSADRFANASAGLAVALGVALTLVSTASSPALSQQPVIPPPGAVVKTPPPAVTDEPIAIKRNGNATVVVPRAAPNAATREATIHQGIKQIRPVLRTELRLLTTVAEPTPAQRSEIAIEAGRTLKEYVLHLATNTQANRPAAMAAILADPRKLVREHLESAALSKLSKEQFTRYQDELNRKTEALRETVILNLVANLDSCLYLDAGQREKLTHALRSNLNDRDYAMLRSSLAYATNATLLVEKHIFPILTEDQRRVSRSSRKTIFTNLTGPNPLEGRLTIDFADLEQDEDVKAALGEEPKP